MPNPKKNKNRKKRPTNYSWIIFGNIFFFFFVSASAFAAGALQRILFQHIFENKRITYKTENFNRQRGRDYGMGEGEGQTHFYFHFHFDFQCVRFRLECVATRSSQLARQQLTFSIFRLPEFLYFPFVVALSLSLLCCVFCVCCLAGYLWILIQVHVAEIKSKFLNLALHKPPPHPSNPQLHIPSSAFIYSYRGSHLQLVSILKAINPRSLSPCPALHCPAPSLAWCTPCAALKKISRCEWQFVSLASRHLPAPRSDTAHPSLFEGVFCVQQQQLKAVAANVSLSENVSAYLTQSFAPLHGAKKKTKTNRNTFLKLKFFFRSRRPRTTGMATLATCNCNHAMYSFCIRRRRVFA